MPPKVPPIPKVITTTTVTTTTIFTTPTPPTTTSKAEGANEKIGEERMATSVASEYSTQVDQSKPAGTQIDIKILKWRIP